MPAVQTPCPKCHQHCTAVVMTTRSVSDHLVRRRHCRHCQHRWYTVQHPEWAIPDDALFWTRRQRCVDLDPRHHLPPVQRPVRMRRINLSSPGEKNPNSVLTAADVIDLRRRYLEGSTYKELAKHFGITTSTAYRIVKRKMWAHL